MKSPPIKQHWLDRAIEVHNFHVRSCKDNPFWTIVRTAEVLNRSVGSVSQDIKLAQWSLTHDKQLRRCSSMKDGLRFIAEKEREMRMREA